MYIYASAVRNGPPEGPRARGGPQQLEPELAAGDGDRAAADLDALDPIRRSLDAGEDP